jgi:cleavage stimulation factor subunit 1
MYDVNNHTSFCYTAGEDGDDHTAAITRVEYSRDGSKFVSSSKDGSIKVWDGISNK